MPARPARGFVDICCRMPADLAAAGQPSVPARHMPLLTPAKSDPGAARVTEAVLTEFTADFTTRLIERCASHCSPPLTR